MPLTIEFKQKQVGKNENTKKVIDILNRVLTENRIDDDTLKEVAKTEQKGLWGNFLWVAEKVTGRFHNFRSTILAPVKVELDASAFVLYNLYENYLNTVIKKMDSNSAKKSESKDITNPYTLLREFLLRVVAIALKVKVDDASYGEKIIKFLEEFIKAINESEICIKNKWFSKELTPLGIHLASRHDDWIIVFRKMIETIKAIHLPKTSISEMLTAAYKIKISIARHIIIRSGYNVQNEALSENWIMTTFMEFEKSMSSNLKQLILQEKAEDMETSLAVATWNTTQITSIQQEICKNLAGNSKVDSKKITDLFRLFNKTNLLFQACMQMENLINIGGWVPILTGLIDINSLGQLFQEHLNECDAHLKLTQEELEQRKSDKNYLQLVKYKAPQYSIPAFSIFHNLKLLKSPIMQQRIFDIISGSVLQLQEINSEIRLLRSSQTEYNLVSIKELPIHKKLVNYSEGQKSKAFAALENIPNDNNNTQATTQEKKAEKPAANRKSHKLDSHAKKLTSFILLDEETVLSSSDDGLLKAWDFNLKCKWSIKIQNEPILLIAKLPKNRLIVISEHNIKLLNTDSRSIIVSWDFDKLEQTFSSMGYSIKTSSALKNKIAFASNHEILPISVINIIEISDDNQRQGFSTFHSISGTTSGGHITPVVLLADDLIAYEDYNYINVDRLSEKRGLICNFLVDDIGKTEILLSLSNSQLASAHKKGAIKVWDIEKKECVWRTYAVFENDQQHINCLLAINLNYLAAGLSDGTVHVFNIQSNQEKPSYIFKAETSVTALCMLPNNQLLCGCESGIIEAWDLSVLLKGMSKISQLTFSNTELLSNYQGDQFTRHKVSGDGECGYTAFGITRDDAYKLLINNVSNIKNLLKPVVQETLLNEKFVEYLEKRKLATPALSKAFKSFQTQTRQSGTSDLKPVMEHANDIKVIQGFIDYDVRDRNIDRGWPHPAILQALATLRGIELYIWGLNEQGKLLPHKGELFDYSQIVPPKTEERIDLLYIGENHFDLLVLDEQKDPQNAPQKKETKSWKPFWENRREDSSENDRGSTKSLEFK